MLRWLTLFCTFFSLAYPQSPLLERLAQGKNGDYVVFEANKTITLLAIRSVHENSLILEEITAPKPKDLSIPWSEWLQKRAPGHTSWSMMEVNLKTEEVIEAYSFSRNAWIPTSSKGNFFATLLKLETTPLPQEKWRRIGPAPLDGEPDLRKIWLPPLYVEGKAIKPVVFDAFETSWPNDGSELAEKTIVFYLDRDRLLPLPTWLQIDTGQLTVAIRAIDAGHGLAPSFYRILPKRSPEFVGAPRKMKNGNLQFIIKAAKYYRDFELFAVDITTNDKQIHLLRHTIAPQEEELAHLEVEEEELRQQLQANHSYTWLLVPTSHSGSFSEQTKPFIWHPLN